MKKIGFILAFLVLTSIGYSQAKPSPFVSIGGENQKLQELLVAKIEYIRSVLDLNQKEADLFWPLYSEYVKKRDLFTLKKKSCMTGLSNFATGAKKYEDINIKTLVERYNFFDGEIANLDRGFYNDILKFLPIKKIALYYKADEDFRIKIIQQLKGQNFK